LMAEAANPEWTSVPLIGWSLSRALANVADVHLVTHIRNRDAIIRAGLMEGRDFTTIDNERVAAPLYKLAQRLRGGAGKGWTTNMAVSSLAYYSLELEVWRESKTRIASHEFRSRALYYAAITDQSEHPGARLARPFGLASGTH